MKKKTVSYWKKKAWKEFSNYILSSNETKLGLLCFSCETWHKRGKGMHAGHFQPGRYAIFLFDERQVHPQCYRCNINLKGNWPRYYENMVKEYGQEEVDQMIEQGKQLKQWKAYELEEIYKRYKALNKQNEKI